MRQVPESLVGHPTDEKESREKEGKRMSTMISEVYDALLAAGAPEEKARKAAEVLAAYDSRFAHIERDLTLLKWQGGVTLAFLIAMFWKLFAA
jgi:phosphate uptake regulator